MNKCISNDCNHFTNEKNSIIYCEKCLLKINKYINGGMKK